MGSRAEGIALLRTGGTRIGTRAEGIALLRTGGTRITSGGLSRFRAKLAKAKAERDARIKKEQAAARLKAKIELERARQEAIRKEAMRRETARKVFEKAFARAKAGRSVSAQKRAREVFIQAQDSAKKEREKTAKKERRIFEEIVKGRKVPRVLVKGVEKIVLSLPELEREFAKTNVGKVFDVVSGGTLTERELTRQASKLDRDIEIFNKKFGGRALSEKEFDRAKREENTIGMRQEILNRKKDELVSSTKGRIGAMFYWKYGFGAKNRENSIEAQKEMIKRSEDKLKSLKKEGLLTDIRRKLLKRDIKSFEKEKLRLEGGGEVLRMYAGTVPITPAGIPVGIPKNLKVTFLGTQKMKGNKIITDIVFKVGKKRIGIAKGVTISRTKDATTIVLGKSGVRAVKFPTQKIGIIKKQVFAGIEKTVSKQAKFLLRSKLKILKKIRMEIPKIKLPGAKTITLIRRNIKGFKQAGFGRVISAKGDKLFKAGKRVKGFKTSDFASISGILTKQDLSLIIGKTITTAGDKARFIGIIKGSRGVGSLTGIQKSQYQVALKKVISVVASATTKADKVKGLTSAQRIIVTQQIIKKTIEPAIVKKVAVLKPKLKPIVRPSVAPLRLKQIPKARTKRKQKVAQLSAQGQSIKQRIAQVTKARQKAKTKLAQRTLQKTRQRLKMRLKILTIQKQKVAAIELRLGFIPTPAQAEILGLVIPKVKKKIRKPPKKPPKKPRSFHVYARPLRKKGRKKPKLIRVTKRPIKKRRARDLRNYLVDTSLSRTAGLKGSGRKPFKQTLKAPTGYASKTQKKFRKFKIVKGKKIPLRKWRVIERKRHLLDTKQEKKQITLRKRIAQMQKQARKPVMKSPTRSPVRKSVTPLQSSYNRGLKKSIKRKRKASPAQLAALAKGRAIRMKNLRKR